ncbi:PucR family transcriptional regulator [Streptomyces sp. ID05-47C]|uniref:PucR family transcriptional regulator n=1 Tax=Streptomyces sp. ID05-47C TaxID=3028665 RepID=UPI0029B38E55|nr:helix-turn-helix domain-containing protein [Streptomyces sp. ID05-47C]MDX3567878.1 helix-turn-helix domain-containing protein [Streptomyces sp. ID05-47C]
MQTAAPDVAILIRLVAERCLAEIDDMLADIDAATFEVAPILAEDPVLAAESRASIRANVLRLLTVLQRQPGEPVPRGAPLETLDLARTLMRRGIELEVLVQAYRCGQDAAWRRWMDVAATTVEARDDLVAVLRESSALLSDYMNGALDAAITRIREERQDLHSGELARRAETIRLLLDGAPIGADRAGRRLDYDLTARHTAMVLWADPPGETHGVLERSAGLLAAAVHARRPLTLPAGTSTLWAWIATRNTPDWDALREAMSHAAPGVRAVLGPSRDGLTGFRRSHSAALAAQGLLGDNPDGDRLTTYQDVEVVALASHDMQQAREFVSSTLGPLCGTDPALATLRSTLRIYLDEGGNAPRTAERLHTHRNTVLQRVARAESLLGYRLAERRLAVSLALELLRRLGNRALMTRPG